ncbi:ATP-binding protein [Desulfobotulus sp. H1]|uniref:histidine kinase n=1 Tax=Desulfobotulus pelophilus TaxID=2823377 RepID=A0ABT3N7I3_9BACT|nr:ATP-binding protein [Desulfobotulus pelophilus]MCW7753121.1 ATP-binding protein [Desulfobotulus pelophilus]
MFHPSHFSNFSNTGSRWLIPSLIFILALVILSMALTHNQRTQRDMVRILMEKGHLLTRSLEAGTRTGMMGRLGEAAQLKTLFEETTTLPDIFYILLTGPNGRVYVNADPDGLAGRTLSSGLIQNLPSEHPEGWTISGKGQDRHFLFHHTFTPLPRTMGHHTRARRAAESPCGSPFCGDLFQPSSPPMTLVVGMDVDAFDAARSKDVRHTFIMAGTLMLLAVFAVLALFRAEALRQSKLRLRDTQAMSTEIIRSFPAGLLVLDASGRLRFANQTAEELLEKPLQRLTGHSIFPHLPQTLSDLFREEPDQLPESEVLLPSARGLLPVSVTLSPIHGQDHLLGRVLVLRDLSQIRRLEEEVRRKEKLAAVGQLAAGVAHEIRNPLSSIKGFATHFRQLFAQDSPHHEAADILIREVNRMDRVIGELLEFARPSDIQPVPTLPTPLIHHALRLIEPDTRAAAITLHAKIPELPEILMDPDRITQVLLNLCLNAIQAMKKEGKLTVSAHEDGQWLYIQLEDTGCGIPETDLTKIFDPFYTTKSKGTGLGLAVVEKIVTAHNGRIEVNNMEQGGTTFTLSFPL